MEAWLKKVQALMGRAERFRWHMAGGAVLLLLVSAGLFWLVILGKTRNAPTPVIAQSTSTATVLMVPRRLDGVLVPAGQEALPPRAVMIENHSDARPLSGLSKASLVIEAPVEGGITRFLAFYDATTTLSEVGPIRSARPYYVDWAEAWHASYFHVGGSPEALTKIRGLTSFADVNEFASASTFWRDQSRFAPHNVYSKKELMDIAVEKKVATGTAAVFAWHFQDAASSTDRGTVSGPVIAYGGTYNVRWTYDAARGTYVRMQGGKIEIERDGSSVEAENVVVIKTEQKVLDSVGRLQLRTTGSGDAVAYRDGKRFPLRWTRGPGEVLRLVSSDGTEFLFTRGRTWIEVTTDDITFSGFGG